MRRTGQVCLLVGLMTLFIGGILWHFQSTVQADDPIDPGGGTLIILDSAGNPGASCPLRKTEVSASISGPIARVNVTQIFYNPTNQPIEAIYLFPLSNHAAVDGMNIHIGSRRIVGKINRREEAERIYHAARQSGRTAALLTQERPNVFTQSVANIGPKEVIRVEITYAETLAYETGQYQFVFPTVVGPRYQPVSSSQPALIQPPVTTRPGHTLSISVTIDAGKPIQHLVSTSHLIKTTTASDHSKSTVQLQRTDEIPNRDFILTYQVAEAEISDVLLTHCENNDGYFTFLLHPPHQAREADISPKEIVFVVDTSGSMSGPPLEKAKECIFHSLAHLNPRDTFNLITFAGHTSVLFPKPVPATPENIEQAKSVLDYQVGGGGTEMMPAIRAALAPSDEQDHLRIVCFMTDGYVGNEFEILGEIQLHPNARVFSFGVGEGVNRFLLDTMALEGGGEAEYVQLTADAGTVASRFYERVRNPLLTDVWIDWGRLGVQQVFPMRIPDLFSAKPVVIAGRYTQPGAEVIHLHGKLSGRPFVRAIKVELLARNSDHEVLRTLWARKALDHLQSEAFGETQGYGSSELNKKAITQLGLTYRLLTQYTAFVAVEETPRFENQTPLTYLVPVAGPEGTGFAPTSTGSSSGETAPEDFSTSGILKKLGLQLVGLIMSLFVASIYCLAIGVERWLTYATVKHQNRRLKKHLRELPVHGDLRQTLDTIAAFPKSTIGRVLTAGLMEMRQPDFSSLSSYARFETVQNRIRQAQIHETQHLRQGLRELSTAGWLAILAGWAGGIYFGYRTILYVFFTKYTYAFSLGELSEQLLPIPFGLVVGIAALWMYTWLNASVQRQALETETSVAEVIKAIQVTDTTHQTTDVVAEAVAADEIQVGST